MIRSATFILLMGFFAGLPFPSLSAQSAQSANDSLRFRHIRTGMSQSSASNIFEDSQGFLWVGTNKGLNKYDGIEFRIFEKGFDGSGGLSNDYIESIYEDSEGILYIGTRRGLNIYDRKLDTVGPYKFKEPGRQLANKLINSIVRTGNFLWLGTHHSGLHRYDMTTGSTLNLSFEAPSKRRPNDNRIIHAFPLSDGQLLVVTQGARYIVDHQLQIKKRWDGKGFTSCALRTGPSEFYLGSRDGRIVRMELDGPSIKESEPISISEGHAILSMEKDQHGQVWIGTENGGLSIYESQNGRLTSITASYKRPQSISGNSIWSLHMARNGVMWVGYFKKGISFYDPDFYKFNHIKTDPFSEHSLSNDIVNCFAEDDYGNLWIGTDGGGLSYWNRNEGTYDEYSADNGKLNNNVVLSLLEDQQNRLWVGTWGGGLTIFEQDTGNVEVWTTENTSLASNYVRSMIQDSKGRIWIAAFNGGVHVYDPETEILRDVSLVWEGNGKEVMAVSLLFEDDQHDIWVGTQTRGLFRLTGDGSGWTSKHYHTQTDAGSLSNDFVNAITQAADGTLWVGTQAGLHKYLPVEDGFETVLTNTDGLANDAINGIVQDQYGMLWLGTGRGIVLYDPKKGDYLNYDLQDGLQGSEYNSGAYFKTSDEEMLFGGNNGFNLINADDAQKRTDQPKVLISALKIFNRDIRPTDSSGILREDINQLDSITLSYEHSVIEFEYHALTFRHAELVDYAYFLEGFEKDWNYVGNKTNATYTNLNPGNYRLRIKSTNSDGIWNHAEKSLIITITPPFWATWWFRILTGLLVVGIFVMAYRMRMRHVKNYQANLERQIAERTHELQLQKNKLSEAAQELSTKNEEIQRFTYAVSHDLKSPLNNIQTIAGLIPMELESKDTAEVEKCLDLIHVSCDIMASLIADITEIAKLGKIENKRELLNTNDIMRTARDLIRGRFDKGKVQLHIDPDLPPIYGDRNRIIQVFGNLLDNAIKYMGDQTQPQICVEAYTHMDSVTFRVTDNGSGMDARSLEELFAPFVRFHSDVKGTGLGLYMVKQIVASHGGQISAASAGKGLGSTFSVTLPLAESSMMAEKNSLLKANPA